MVADALAVLAAAERRAEADTVAARAIVRAITTDVLARLEGADHGHGARRVDARRGGADRGRLRRRREGARPAPRAADDVGARPHACGSSAARARSPRGTRQDRASRSARRSCRSALESEPAVALAARVEERAHALGHARTCRSRRCRTSSRRSSSSPATCAWPSATSSTAPSARCCARASGSRRARAAGDPGGRGRRRASASGPAPTCASGSRSRRSGSTCRSTPSRSSASCGARSGPGSRAQDLQRLVVLNAKALMERDAEYSRFAGRVLLTYVYEETLGWDIVRDGVGALKGRARARRSPATLRHGVKIGRIDPRLLEYDLAAPRRRDRPDRRPGLRLPRPADAV